MLQDELKKYKRKYYQNAILKGSIFAISLTLTAFLLINTIEYFSSLNSIGRAVFFFSFILIFLVSSYFWIFRSLFKLINTKQQISDQEAADRIGKHFPEIGDKLLNTLQLSTSTSSSSDLVQESIKQKSTRFTKYKFSEAINFNTNRKYLRYVIPPVLLTIIIFLFIPQLFTESTPRIINYRKEFKPEAPFSFNITNNELRAFKGEDFTLSVNLSGLAIPENVQILTSNDRKLRMTNDGNGNFSYTFTKIQRDIDFYLEASGFNTSNYNLKVLSRPSLNNFSAYLDFPNYTGKKDNRVVNTGNLVIPEGTKITWGFKTQETESLKISFDSEKNLVETNSTSKNTFEFSRVAGKSEKYQVLLQNEYSKNKDIIEYYLNVIPDEYPTISLSQYEDTVLYESLILGGNIGDDYGIKNLVLKYRISNEERKEQEQPFQSMPINFNPTIINQSFFHKLEVSDLNLANGDQVEYYVEVWDNDGVNGSKKTKSAIYEFKLPTKKEFRAELAKESRNTQNQIDNTLKEAKSLNQQVKDLQDRLKGKRKLDWQDKQSVQELIKKQENLSKDLDKLKELNETLKQKQEKFSTEDKELAEKAEQLQKLMDELLDEETKKLYEELNELLEQNYINKNFQEVLDDIEMKHENLENELDRALELFKKLKFDTKAEEIIEDLKELAEKQEELGEQTEDAKKNNLEDIKEQQEQLNEEFEDIQKELDELDKLNESLENQKDLEQFDKQEQNIEQQQQDAQQQLDDNKKKKASESQKKGAQEMKQMAQQMQQMQQSMEMQQLSENYDDLRKILENLMTLSFDQEDLMLEFKKVRRIDPKFVELSQRQLKLKDDSKLIQDSLVALSKRVFQIESFVTREVTQMNKYMEESLDAIRKRTPEIASSKQQFTMTSVNNLALLLNDILQQMQQQMSQSMSGKQMSEQQQGSPQLSQLQQQLNQRIQDLKKSGKSGRALSEELAKLAAEQEMIRNALKNSLSGKDKGKQKQGKKNGEGSEDGGKDGSGGYGDLLEQMEMTEEDLVNKQLTQETIMRQKEILTRLLESEKAEKERELDNEREAEQAEKKENNRLPEDFKEYLKLKETQVELLKTIPTSLNKYYKQEVNEYFKKLKN